MKHAYLIIAHNEFDVLRRLVSALDDGSNDIFIHFDKKVDVIPEIRTHSSGLFILHERVEVRWGTVSQIECEYALFEQAFKAGSYSHFLLISGTHFPLVRNERISLFLKEHCGQTVFPYMDAANEYQVDMKMRRVNFLPGTVIWRALLKVQRLLGIRINKDCRFHNAGNWAVFSAAAVTFLLENKKRILGKYRWTFCGDEFFGPTELMNSELADTVVFSKTLLKFEMGRSNARTYRESDYQELVESGCLFARKFSEKDLVIIEELLKYEQSC